MDYVRSNRVREFPDQVNWRNVRLRTGEDPSPVDIVPEEDEEFIPGSISSVPTTEPYSMSVGSAATAGVYTPVSWGPDDGPAAIAYMLDQQRAIRRTKRYARPLTRRSEEWFRQNPQWLDDYYNGDRILPTADQQLNWRRYKGIFARKYRRYGRRRMTKAKSYSPYRRRMYGLRSQRSGRYSRR